MLERSIRHAWKAKRASDTEPAPTRAEAHSISDLTLQNDHSVCVHKFPCSAGFKPERRSVTKADRLTIRAEVLPDDSEWHIGRMPSLIHTMPLSPTWNGRPDPLGGAADGMLIETSHVTIQGLRILGLPVVESPRPGLIRRLCAISRLRRDLEDLEIAQCLFAGEEVTNPNHVGVIAHGNAIHVHHCIFRGLKISVVFWTPGSTGHAMTSCIGHDLCGSGVWTAGIAGDFVYRHNVVNNGNYVWTAQGEASAQADAGGGGRQSHPAAAQAQDPIHYQVVGSYFAATGDVPVRGPEPGWSTRTSIPRSCG